MRQHPDSYTRKVFDAMVAQGAQVRAADLTSSVDDVVLLIVTWPAVGIAQPITMHLREADLVAYVSSIAVDSSEVFPHMDPTQAGLSMMLVHIDEALQSAGPDLKSLTVSATGIQVARDKPDRGSSVHSHQSHEWRAARRTTTEQ